MRARFKVGQVPKLFFGNTGFSAYGRMNVDSKRAAHHDSDFNLGELLQYDRNGSGRCMMEIHSERHWKQLRIVGPNAESAMNFAATPLCQPINDSRPQSRILVKNPCHSCHVSSSPKTRYRQSLIACF